MESVLASQEGISFVRPTNIGLRTSSVDDSETMIVLVPEQISNDTIPEVMLWESPFQKSQQWIVEGWKNMKKGATNGRKAGLTIGKFFCPSSLGNSVPSLEGYLAVLLLCGGGVVGGSTVGLVMGGVVGPILYFEDDVTSQSLSYQNITILKQGLIRGIWKELVALGPLNRLGTNGATANEGELSKEFAFGSLQHPYNAQMEIQPLRLQLVQLSTSDFPQLALRFEVNVNLFDLSQQVIAKQRIHANYGEFTYQEWAENNAQRLRSTIRQIYKQNADRIADALRSSGHRKKILQHHLLR
ncbi:MAG: hypothetical protein NPIRA02_10510 [Nitrospirales bacterium]|nr:MAG: hypothetical protein NPIRA02_10510 [Nitrospirales bacterium]